MRALLAGVLTLAFAAALAASETARHAAPGASGDAARPRAASAARRSPRRHAGGPATAGATTNGVGGSAAAAKSRRTGCLVTGRVVGPDGEPVDGAEVRVVNAFGRVAEKPASDDGAFEVEIATTDAVRCVARAAGRVPVASAWATAEAGGAIDAGTLVLVPGERIAGRVSDPLGCGIKGAYVSCVPADDDALEAWHGFVRQDGSKGATCGDDGAFVLRGLPPGRYSVSISPPGACPWWSDGEVVEAGGKDVVLTMPAQYAPRCCALDVRAEDEDGNALPGFYARLSAWRSSEGRNAEDGHVSLGLIESPPFRLTVGSLGCEEVTIDDVSDRPYAIVVRLPKAREVAERRAISGVVEFEGEPLPAEAPVELHLYATTGSGSDAIDACTADEGGEFVLTPKASGSYRIAAEGRVRLREGGWAYVTGRADVASGDTGVRVRVLPKSSIGGVVGLPGDAEPDELWVTVVEGRPGGVERTEQIERARRAFSIDGLPSDGVFRVGVSVRVGEEWMRGTVAGGVVAGRPPVEFRVEPGFAVEGVVVRRDGSPVAGAQVWTEAERPHYRIAATGVDGRFRLTGLRDGTERLRAWAPGLALDGRAVTASAGANGVRIVVAPDGR